MNNEQIETQIKNLENALTKTLDKGQEMQNYGKSKDYEIGYYVGAIKGALIELEVLRKNINKRV